ncbi:hypothetical protein BKA58DRAFT_377251 [Alternaria rosae]|uniref:uncharacterized protein n=1 Tax=Alternaria rosae TaxID=1187941 RepID=UPI001E8D0731|nr:uncharacterized protein BKA58DRAFT_377251 [Alternaria rosae]KAH6878438.1 hypothetical protein BKA58DRAFT_377251 [Alternaria rosae]
MTKLITIVGATGIQGGSVVDTLAKNPAYSIRAITRDRNGKTAHALTDRGIEVVEADLNNVESLQTAFAGSQAIFAMTNFFDALPKLGIEKCMEIETQQGINLANAASAIRSLEHFVWSTLPNSKRISGGRAVVPYWHSKARVDEHIKSIPTLLQKTTFVWFGWYAKNMEYPWYQPSPVHQSSPEKQYIQLLASPPSVRVQMVGDERTNVGLFVESILEQPDMTLAGKYVLAAVEDMSFAEIVSAFGAAKGLGVVQHVRVTREVYTKLWPFWADLMDDTHSYFELMAGKSFSGEEVILTVKDLGVEGLVGSAEAFKALSLID